MGKKKKTTFSSRKQAPECHLHHHPNPSASSCSSDHVITSSSTRRGWGAMRTTTTGPGLLLLLVLVSCYGAEAFLGLVSSASVVPRGSGNIGCLFGKTLCDTESEWCYNDFAFGKCLLSKGIIQQEDLYKYDLSKEDMHTLKKQLERLFALGYLWGHEYTQCILQTSLGAIRYGVDVDESVCKDVRDPDLEGALKAFEEDIDPWNLAFIKYAPSSNNPYSDYADESYQPPKEAPRVMNNAGGGDEIVTGREVLLTGGNESPPSSSSKLQLKEQAEMLDEELAALMEQELESTVAKMKGENSKPNNGKGHKGGKKGKNKNKQRPNKDKVQVKKSLETPGQSDNFNGVDIGGSSAKKLVMSTDNQWDEGPASVAMPTSRLLKSILLNPNNGLDEDALLNSEGVVNDNVLQPRIFSSLYNTPDSFRQGFGVDDDVVDESEMNGNGDPEQFLMAMRRRSGGGLDGASLLFPGEQQLVDDDGGEEMPWRLAGDARDYLGVSRGDGGDGGESYGGGRREELEPEQQEQLSPLEAEELLLSLLLKDQDDPNIAPRRGWEIAADPDADPLRSEEGSLLYTEGGLVLPRRRVWMGQGEEDEAEQQSFLSKYQIAPEETDWVPDEEALLENMQGDYETVPDDNGGGFPAQLFFLDRESRDRGGLGLGFERRERLDVKKPGPWYRTVNSYAFDKADKNEDKGLDENLEFGGGEGPADMFSAGNLEDGESVKERVQHEVMQNDEQPQVDKKSAPVPFVPIVPPGHYDTIDTSYVTIFLSHGVERSTAVDIVYFLADALDLDRSVFGDITNDKKDVIIFKVEPNGRGWNASDVAKGIQNLGEQRTNIEGEFGVKILRTDFGVKASGSSKTPSMLALYADGDPASNQVYVATFAVCGLVAAVLVGAVAIFLIRKHSKSRDKMARLSQDDPSFGACKDYQELCRARMAGSKTNEKMEPIRGPAHKIASKESENGTNSSRSEEPVLSNMDISTGHMVLSYMEDHLKNKDRLDKEWEALSTYEADPCSTAISEKTENSKKNRYSNALPFDHSRVVLNDLANVTGTDYINASTITDHDPRNPAYIATQGPLPNTAADFWQMVWEQGSVVIVNLTRLAENGSGMCHRYWPEEGSELHHIYEVHLVSEHIWCDEYLVRSFYLKNLKTGETRTVTQFHFLAWPENGVPASTKALLEFRRKVNKSYRGRSCPIIVHCSDGTGRTGTYSLIDMVLNRMTKGAKEIDIAASLEHIRDQRPNMVKTKQQFEFVLMAVAEEVHAILKALPQ